MEDEYARQWHEVAGGLVVTCEHCGRIIEPAETRMFSPSDRNVSGGADVVTVCVSCWQKIASGEFEAEPMEEVEPDIP